MGREKKSYKPADTKYIQLPPIQVASYWMYEEERIEGFLTIGGLGLCQVLLQNSP